MKSKQKTTIPPKNGLTKNVLPDAVISAQKKAQEAFDAVKPYVELMNKASKQWAAQMESLKLAEAEDLSLYFLERQQETDDDTTTNTKTRVYLNDKGELYLASGKIRLLMRGTMREKLIRSLKCSFTSTDQLRQMVEAASIHSVQQSINKIRSKVKHIFGLSADFIECSTGRGYRIDPAYELIIVRD